jgi:hypothetical protein
LFDRPRVPTDPSAFRAADPRSIRIVPPGNRTTSVSLVEELMAMGVLAVFPKASPMYMPLAAYHPEYGQDLAPGE